MTDLTDYRARIREALEDAYEGISRRVDERHDRAVDAVWEIAREATRAVSEEVVRLRLADANRAAAELLGGLIPADVVVHLCPPGDEAQMPCCGGWPLERLGEWMTTDPALVTCPGRGGAS